MSKDIVGTPRILTIVRLAFLLWLSAVFVGTLFPAWRVWGLHLPAFLPYGLRIAFFGCGLILLILPGRLFGRVAGQPAQRLARMLQSSIMALILFVCFILFHASPALLGDGRLRGREAQSAIIRPVEYLSGWLAAKVYELGHPVFGIDGWLAVAIVSIFAGCLFLVFIWYYPRRIWPDSRDGLIVRALLVAGSLSALFYGYVESYALPCALMTGALLAAEAARRGRGPFFPVIVLLFAATMAHFISVILFPAVFALALAWHERRFGRLIMAGSLVVAASVWAYFVFHVSTYADEAAMGRVMIPLLSHPPTYYGLFSLVHLLDVANLLFLVCPGVLIAAPILYANRQSTTNPSERAFFWPLAIAGGVAMVLLLDPKLGLARDWDLFGLGLLPLIVWSATRLADLRVKMSPGVVVHPLVTQAMVLIVFVSINARQSAALDRFDNLLELDPSRGGYGHEILAGWYHDHGDIAKEIQHWRKAVAVEDNKRYWGALALAYLRNGDYQFGLRAAHTAYAKDTSWAKGAFYLASAYRELQHYDSALVYYDRSLRLDAGAHNVRHDLATLCLSFGQYDAGLRQIDVALQQAPDSAVYHSVRGWILFEAGRLDECGKSLRHALALDPDLIPARVNLSRWLYRTGRADSALAEIDHILLLPDVPAELREHLLILGRSFRNPQAPPDSAG